MELTAFASFLDTAFGWYDSAILTALHAIRCGLLTAFFKFLTIIGEKGIVFFLIAVVLMLFPKTRKTGICLFGAVGCGALITNIILKDWVARPRPFNFEPYVQFWKDVGSPAEDSFSFPSGHVTSAAAGMMALRLMKGKKWTVPAIVWVVLMALARNYLVAHYPSDVLFGALIGVVSAVIAYYITQLIYNILHSFRRTGWAQIILSWSAPDFAGIPSRLRLVGDERDERAEAEEPAARSTRSVRSERGERAARPSSGYKGRHEK